MKRRFLPGMRNGPNTGRPPSWRTCFVINIIVLAVLGALLIYDPIGPILARPLEARFSATNPDGPVTGIIALGGHLVRTVEAVKLAQRYPKAKLVVSVRGDPYSSNFLSAHDFLKGRLILESKSRNTYENATVAAALVVPKPGERWILVTSGSHMPRAVGAFRKAGFTVHPWPVIYGSERDRLSLRITIHEWLGLIFYRLTGRIDSLFPGPRAPH
jgi:uncharacterized SAM-binding protein YcdF (DUF218 family)